MAVQSPHVRCRGINGLRYARMWLEAEFDPHVWSGRALQEDFVELAGAVLHQCIRSQIGVVLLQTIMDISARAFSLADRPRSGHWGSPVFACAGKTDPPSRLILSQTSAGNVDRVTSSLAPHIAQFLCSSQGPFLRPGPQNVDRAARRGGQGRPSRLACGRLRRCQAAP